MKYRISCATCAVAVVFLISGCGSQQQKESAELRNTVVYVKIGMQPGMNATQKKAFDECVLALNNEQREVHAENGHNKPLYLAQAAPMRDVQKENTEYLMNSGRRAMFSALIPFGIGTLFGKDKQSREQEFVEQRATMQQHVGMCWSQKQTQLHAR
ncbi:MAG: hypothetical protein AB2748_02465 [Candidatus Thiodiazotropha endolucinida]